MLAMMISLTMIAIGPQATTSAPPKPAAEPVVQIGIFSSGPDGANMAAYETSLSTESFHYVSGCGLGGGARPVPAEASDAWRLSGTVQQAAAGEAVVQLDWQRIRSDGRAVTTPGGSVQLTLHPGDRVPLDSVDRPATSQCPAATIALEARYDARPGAWISRGRAGTGAGIGGARAGGAGASGGDASVASGGGVGAGIRGGTGTGSASGTLVNPSHTSVHMPKTAENQNAESRPFDADLWLVRTAPGRQESTLHQALTGVRGGAQFAFSPVSIDTGGGILNVQVAGSFRVTADEAGAPQLEFSTTRAVRFTPAGRSGRDAPPATQGSSVTTHPMPGPEDVLSFEMPPLRVPNGTTPVPDQFSIRVRVR